MTAAGPPARLPGGRTATTDTTIIDQIGIDALGYPVLHAWRAHGLLYVWCTHCGVWHRHGAVSETPGSGDGHRVAHCVCPSSTFAANGYVLHEVGSFTADVRRAHGREVSPSRRCQPDSCRFDRERARWRRT